MHWTRYMHEQLLSSSLPAFKGSLKTVDFLTFMIGFVNDCLLIGKVLYSRIRGDLGTDDLILNVLISQKWWSELGWRHFTNVLYMLWIFCLFLYSSTYQPHTYDILLAVNLFVASRKLKPVCCETRLIVLCIGQQIKLITWLGIKLTFEPTWLRHGGGSR